MTSKEVKPHRIGFYIRVSTEEAAENPEGSIRNQEERLRATVQLKNSMEGGKFGEIAEIFIDRAKSGKDTNRPELQKLLQAIRRKEISLVMASELSRLSRSIRDFSGIWELMQSNGCGFLSLRENFDTTTAAGEMVLYSVANIAQFERRQVQERTSANMQARASRGLYNGGAVPLGYQLIPEKKGYLAIDEEQAKIVRTAFETFLREGTLTLAAKWLNKKGYHYKRQMEGGGSLPRLGHFTVQNLHDVLKNKSYTGTKVYRVKGEIRETKAVWDPIVDIETYNRVQEILKKNFRRLKPKDGPVFPFILSGLLQCGSCGERLCGKTANGNAGRIAYYEHAWATKRQACLVKKVFECKPNRILARILEPLVWDEVEKILTRPKEAQFIIEEARTSHLNDSRQTEISLVKRKVSDLKSQLDALAERIAHLPQTLSVTPFYKQMEKIEVLKKMEEEKLSELESKGGGNQSPTSFESYCKFLDGIQTLTKDLSASDTKRKIIQKLLNRIIIKPETFQLHLYVGEDYIDNEMSFAESQRSILRHAASAEQQTHEVLGGFTPKRRHETFPLFGSNTLDIGWFVYNSPKPSLFHSLTIHSAKTQTSFFAHLHPI